MSISTLTTLQRLQSGIPGLDTLLGGGFFRSGVYIIQGVPGSGKTILANQLCYHHAAAGGCAVYVTLLAESHSRMLQHIQSLSFFSEAAIPESVSYLSAFNVLESDGLKGLMATLRKEMRLREATVLILDGLVAAAEAAPSGTELKKFIHELQTSAVFHDCTVFLLTSGTPQRVNAEHTMVDGILELDDVLFNARSERSIQVRKFRGAGSLRGKHAVRITDAGMQVYPRIESLFSRPPEAPKSAHRVLSVLERRQGCLGVGQEGPACLGKVGAAAHALEQGSAKPVLEQLDATADRRLGAVQPLRRPGKAAGLGDRQEGADFVDVHDQES